MKSREVTGNTLSTILLVIFMVAMVAKPGLSQEIVTVPNRTLGEIEGIKALTPDGLKLIGVVDGRHLFSIDAETGQEIARSPRFVSNIQQVIPYPDSERVVFRQENGQVWLWNLLTRAAERKFSIPSDLYVSSLGLSSDGSKLIIGTVPGAPTEIGGPPSHPAKVYVLNYNSGELLHEFDRYYNAPVRSVGFLLNDTQIIVEDEIWDLASGTPLWPLPVIIDGVSPDGTKIVGRGDGATVAVWDVATRQQMWSVVVVWHSPESLFPQYGLQGWPAEPFFFTADGEYLLCRYALNSNFVDRPGMLIFRVSDGELIRMFFYGSHDRTNSPNWTDEDSFVPVGLTPEGSALVAYTRKHTEGYPGFPDYSETVIHYVQEWSLGLNRPPVIHQPRATFLGHENGSSGALSPGTVVTASDNQLTVANTTGAMMTLVQTDHPIQSVAASSDQVAFSDNSGTVHIIDNAGNPLHQFQAPEAVTAIGFGSILVGTAGGVYHLDSDGNILKQISLEDGSTVTAVAASPDRATILVGTEAGSVYLVSLTTGQPIRQLVGHSGRVTTVAFSPDGKHAITATVTGRMARLWRTETGEQIALFEHDESETVMSAVFSKGGVLTYTTGGSNGTVRRWDVPRPASAVRWRIYRKP